MYNEGAAIFTEVPKLVDYDKGQPSSSKTVSVVKTSEHNDIDFYGKDNTEYAKDFPGFSTYAGKVFGELAPVPVAVNLQCKVSLHHQC